MKTEDEKVQENGEKKKQTKEKLIYLSVYLFIYLSGFRLGDAE